jgi:hypothetical protein
VEEGEEREKEIVVKNATGGGARFHHVERANPVYIVLIR